MSGRRTPPGPGESNNPWVRRLPGEIDEDETAAETEPVVSPWNYPVDPPPGQGGSDPSGGSGTPGRPSLRREPPEPNRRGGGALRRIVLPIVAAIAVVAVLGVVLINVLGDDEPSADPSTDPSASGAPSGATSSGTPSTGQSTPASTGPTTPGSSSTYVPPTNAIPVAYGVSVVPATGWTVFAPETEGKELVPTGANSRSTWFWVRQRQKITAEDYTIRIFEGETKGGSQIKAGPTTKFACPRDVLTECVSIGYTMLLPKDRSGLSMKCEVQSFRRNDDVVTAMDFCARPDFYDKAYADAKTMLKSVIDSQ